MVLHTNRSLFFLVTSHHYDGNTDDTVTLSHMDRPTDKTNQAQSRRVVCLCALCVSKLDQTHGDEHTVILSQGAQDPQVTHTADDGPCHNQAVGGVVWFEGVDNRAILGFKHPEYAKGLDKSSTGL